jgi:hypothetical protein
MLLTHSCAHSVYTAVHMKRYNTCYPRIPKTERPLYAARKSTYFTVLSLVPLMGPVTIDLYLHYMNIKATNGYSAL